MVVDCGERPQIRQLREDIRELKLLSVTIRLKAKNLKCSSLGEQVLDRTNYEENIFKNKN